MEGGKEKEAIGALRVLLGLYNRTILNHKPFNLESEGRRGHLFYFPCKQ